LSGQEFVAAGFVDRLMKGNVCRIERPCILGLDGPPARVMGFLYRNPVCGIVAPCGQLSTIDLDTDMNSTISMIKRGVNCAT
jgi:hypothetical protein